MKKYVVCCIFCFALCVFVFSKTCNDHGEYTGYYCPKCEYNEAYNKGTLHSGAGKQYKDSFCNSPNENKEKICREGYDEGYGEKIWCNNCGKYFPATGHSCKIKK